MSSNLYSLMTATKEDSMEKCILSVHVI